MTDLEKQQDDIVLNDVDSLTHNTKPWYKNPWIILPLVLVILSISAILIGLYAMPRDRSPAPPTDRPPAPLTAVTATAPSGASYTVDLPPDATIAAFRTGLEDIHGLPRSATLSGAAGPLGDNACAAESMPITIIEMDVVEATMIDGTTYSVTLRPGATIADLRAALDANYGLQWATDANTLHNAAGPLPDDAIAADVGDIAIIARDEAEVREEQALLAKVAAARQREIEVGAEGGGDGWAWPLIDAQEEREAAEAELAAARRHYRNGQGTTAAARQVAEGQAVGVARQAAKQATERTAGLDAIITTAAAKDEEEAEPVIEPANTSATAMPSDSEGGSLMGASVYAAFRDADLDERPVTATKLDGTDYTVALRPGATVGDFRAALEAEKGLDRATHALHNAEGPLSDGAPAATSGDIVIIVSSAPPRANPRPRQQLFSNRSPGNHSFVSAQVVQTMICQHCGDLEWTERDCPGE